METVVRNRAIAVILGSLLVGFVAAGIVLAMERAGDTWMISAPPWPPSYKEG